jgi:hypothetical protein
MGVFGLASVLVGVVMLMLAAVLRIRRAVG